MMGKHDSCWFWWVSNPQVGPEFLILRWWKRGWKARPKHVLRLNSQRCLMLWKELVFNHQMLRLCKKLQQCHGPICTGQVSILLVVSMFVLIFNHSSTCILSYLYQCTNEYAWDAEAWDMLELSQSNLGSRSKMQFDLRKWDVFCSNLYLLW